ncbi:MAG: putative polysaccharide biosynthesis protein [Eubacteriales bacterium]
MDKGKFLKGAAILAIAGLLVQVLGAIFRIPLGNIIGDTGMGYYQTAYPIYIFLLVFSTNGAPAAISKMVAERTAVGDNFEAHRVFKISFALMCGLSLVFAGILFFCARPIVEILGNPKAYLSMVCIAPALLFVPIMAVFRGYFQGLQIMTPTAISQLLEQSIRVFVGLSLAVIFLPKGLEYAAAGATIGTSIGPIFGLIALVFIYNKYLKNNKEKILPTEIKETTLVILKKLIAIAVPITIGVSIVPIMNLIDLLIVMRRLQSIGFSQNEANALYGQLTGFAGPIINIPMAMALSMALAMVPAISAAASKENRQELTEHISLGLSMSTIVGFPCSFGLMALSKPIMILLFPARLEAIDVAANCLFILSMGIVFLCIAQTMAGILQGLNAAGMAVLGLFAGCVVKAAVTYILCGIPALNIQGATIGAAIGYLTIGAVNFYAVKKIVNMRFDFVLSIIKPVIAGVFMFAAVIITHKGLSIFISANVATVVSICIGAVVYSVMVIALKIMTADELEKLPKGAKIAKLVRKIQK